MCIVFITFSTLIINNLFNIMHYHIIIITSSTLLSSSSHGKHNNTIHNIFTWKPKSWGGNHGSLFKIVFQKYLEGSNNPLITKTSIFQLQLEGGYDPLIYRLRLEGSCHSLVFRLLPEGGYDLLSLPRPATLIRR